MRLAEWVDEFEQWRAGAVRHVLLHLKGSDGELGFVGEGDAAWAIMHIRDGAVTPLVVGDPQAVWAKRPRRWEGRGHVPVPAVVVGGVRSTFAPIWGRALLGVARCPSGMVILLGIVGEEIGMVALGSEPVLVFVGLPKEVGSVNLDHLDWLPRAGGSRRKLAAATAATATTTTAAVATTAAATAATAAATTTAATATTRPAPLQVEEHFGRVRAALSGALLPGRWSGAAVAEIPEVVDALERWARDGRGSLAGQRRRLYATLVSATKGCRFTLDGFTVALHALAQVCGDFVSPATRQSRTWRINLDPATFEVPAETGGPLASAPRAGATVEAEGTATARVEGERRVAVAVPATGFEEDDLDADDEGPSVDVASVFRFPSRAAP